MLLTGLVSAVLSDFSAVVAWMPPTASHSCCRRLEPSCRQYGSILSARTTTTRLLARFGGDRNDLMPAADEGGASGEGEDDNITRNLRASSSSTNNNKNNEEDERQIRILGIRNKIERLLNGPDPPFDIESEIKKVTSIAPPSPPSHLQRSIDLHSEHRVMELEDEIAQAVQRQDFGSAMSAQQEMSQRHIDDCGAVLQVNANYYRAFSTKQYADMQALWLKDGTATCIHPSQKALVGSKAVLNSWKRMFESSNGAFQKSWMEPHNIRLSVKGATTAVLTCDEHVYARRFVRGQRRETELVNKLVATNIFRKCQGQWYLTHHHASWHSDSDAAKQALVVRGRGGGVRRGGSKSKPNISRNEEEALFQHWIGETLLGGLGMDEQETRYFNNEQDDDENTNHGIWGGSDDNKEIGVDGIMGIENFGPLIGGPSDGVKNKSSKYKNVPSHGIQSINFLGPESGIFDHLGAAGGGGGSVGDGRFGKAILRIDKTNHNNNNINNKKSNKKNKSKGNSGGTLGGGGGSGSFEIGDFAERMMEEFNEVDDDDDDGEEDLDEQEQALQVRQACIATLRNLHAMGALAPRQKRVLLTDMIACAAKGEVSTVEVAYQLLCVTNDDDDDDDDDNDDNNNNVDNHRNNNDNINDDDKEEEDAVALEEFAEQCRIIAASLPESSSSSSSSQ